MHKLSGDVVGVGLVVVDVAAVAVHQRAGAVVGRRQLPQLRRPRRHAALVPVAIIAGAVVPLLLLQFFFDSSHALSSYLTQPYWCDELDLTNVGGVDIMGYPLKLDEHQNTVKISRADGTVLDDGATYVAGETLTVTLSTEAISASRAHQFVFEVHGPAAFAKGPRTGCGGRRATTNVTSLHVAPTGDASGPIRVFAAWSKGYGQVRVTGNFTLSPPPSSATGAQDL